MRVATVITAAILIISPTLVPSARGVYASASSELLEPIVKRYAGVLPTSLCEELIALGEEDGFTVDVESIDADEAEAHRVSSQSIEIFERDDGVTSPAIWEALVPWIPRLTDLVRDSIDATTDGFYYPDKPNRVPQLGWVFFRKYSPDSDRKSLKLHVDSNMHTLNIALNHDFEGGGLFYVKPPLEQEGESHDGRPDVPDLYKNYDWLNRLRRGNTSDIVFPALEGGDVLIHNFTVWHAVAPVVVGTRYSFVLFYDMDNPAIEADFDDQEHQNEGDAIDTDAIPITFYHEIEDEDVQVDLAYVYETEDGDAWMEILEEDMPPFQWVEMDSYEGHVFRALVAGTDTVLSEFVITHRQLLYKITEEDATGDDEL